MRVEPMLLALVLASACGGTTDTLVAPPEGPEPICRQPAAAGPWFVEVTEEIGLGKTGSFEPLATGVVAGDLDGDGWQDLIAAVFPAQREIAGGKRMRFVLMNREGEGGRRVFVDATSESGLLATRDGAGGRGFSVASLGDLDNDGDLDVVACPGSGEVDPPNEVVDPCAAFLNDGSGRFALAPASALEDEVFWVPSSVMLDYDLDGRLDFWPGTVGEWAYGPAKTSAPRLYRGHGDGTFDDVSSEVGLPSAPTEPGNYRINFGVTSCDVDGDGRRDVLLGDYYVQPNYLYLGTENGFVEVGAATGVAKASYGGHTFSITCADLDDDGDADLMRSMVHHPGYPTDTTDLLLGATSPGEPLAPFVRSDPAALGMARAEGWMEGDNIALFSDVDLDGRKDVLLASSNYPQQYAGDPDWTHAWLWRQRDDGTFEDVTSQTPWGDPAHQSLEGPALVDFDGDGDQDLVIGTGAFNGTFLGLANTLRAYRNDIGQTQNLARIRVVGAGPGGANRSGIGAKVALTAAGRTQRQEVLGSWGHSNTQSDTVLTFGLGDACTIDRLELTWPNAEATVSTFEGVLANFELEIVEDEPAVRYGRAIGTP